MENGDAPLSPLSGSVDIDRMLLSPSLPQLAGLGQEIPPSCFDGLHGGMEGLTIEQAGEQLAEGVVKQVSGAAARCSAAGLYRWWRAALAHKDSCRSCVWRAQTSLKV